MPKTYSQDLRDRVIDAVVRAGMSSRAAARRYEISESVAVKWLERSARDRGSAMAAIGLPSSCRTGIFSRPRGRRRPISRFRRFATVFFPTGGSRPTLADRSNSRNRESSRDDRQWCQRHSCSQLPDLRRRANDSAEHHGCAQSDGASGPARLAMPRGVIRIELDCWSGSHGAPPASSLWGRNAAVDHDSAAAISFRRPAVRGSCGDNPPLPQVLASEPLFLKAAASPAEV
jgi:hypothetical protein